MSNAAPTPLSDIDLFETRLRGARDRIKAKLPQSGSSEADLAEAIQEALGVLGTLKRMDQLSDRR